jgi:2-methylcitrate dehydratase PrpD
MIAVATTNPRAPFASLALAQALHSRRMVPLGPKALFWAHVVLVDTLGVIVAGMREPSVQILSNIEIEPGGTVPLLTGGGAKSSSSVAALIHGTAAHALDFDDMMNSAVVHPSGVLVPALFAAAYRRPTRGADLITALGCGFDITRTLGKVMLPGHIEQGWHPTGTIGTIAAAGAVATMLGGSAEEVARAMSIAASLASGLTVNFGSMTKPLHMGRASQAGLLAGSLALGGFTADPAALEGRGGFFTAFGRNAAAGEDLAAILGAEPALESDCVGIKPWSCCGGTHAAIRAALALRETTPDPRAVTEIVIAVHPRSVAMLDRQRPRGAADARFSLQYCVARAWLEGEVLLAHFDEAAVLDHETLALAEHIRLVPIEESAEDLGQFGAEVRLFQSGVQMRSQRSRDEHVGHRNPPDEAALWGKFSDCAGGTIAGTALRKIFEELLAFEAVGNVAHWQDGVTAAAAGAAR